MKRSGPDPDLTLYFCPVHNYPAREGHVSAEGPWLSRHGSKEAMMASMLDEMFGAVLTATGNCLCPLGFRRRGTVFRLIEHGNCAIIEFQRSSKSAGDRLVFTVNLGIVCSDLLDSATELQKARIVDAHLRERIGMLLPGRPDKWWEISDSTESGGLAREVSGLILGQAVPYIQRYLSTSDLVALWNSGRSPGLTEGQRLDLLTQLKDKHKNGAA